MTMAWMKSRAVKSWHLAGAFVVSFIWAPIAWAEATPIVQAGADGRFEIEIDAKSRVEGFSVVQVLAFQRNLRAVTDRLQSIASVAQPPPPVCHRMKSWIELVNPNRVLSASGGVFTPINFNGGRCHRMTTAGIEVGINSPDLLTSATGASVRNAEDKGDWYVLDIKDISRTRIRFATNKVALTHGHAPLLSAISARRYANEMMRRFSGVGGLVVPWRTVLQKMTPEQAMAPACMPGPADRDMLSLQADCPLNRQVFEINGAYFDHSRPADIQLIILSTPPLTAHSENADQLASRVAMWRDLDPSMFAALVQ